MTKRGMSALSGFKRDNLDSATYDSQFRKTSQYYNNSNKTGKESGGSIKEIDAKLGMIIYDEPWDPNEEFIYFGTIGKR